MMHKQDFLSLFQDTLQCEESLTMDIRLADIPDWDSMAAMATIALAERQFGKHLKLAQLKNAETVEDLYALLA